MINKQENKWNGKFGEDYTNTNKRNTKMENEKYINRFNISRTELNKEFLKNKIKYDDRILEIGCNIGVQLKILEEMNYKDLWGIEILDYAINHIRSSMSNINVVKGSALNIPFKDNFFDLVFTSGLLIHISPKNISYALDEIYRCSKSYIWGFEYYLPNEYKMIEYKGQKNLLWKTDFPKLFLDRFNDLSLVHKKILKHDDDNLDIMYLLEKNR